MSAGAGAIIYNMGLFISTYQYIKCTVVEISLNGNKNLMDYSMHNLCKTTL